MVEFLAALMALITTFAQGGKPAELPPYTQEDVEVRGKLVSEAAQNLGVYSSNELEQQVAFEEDSNISEQIPESSKNDGQTIGQSATPTDNENAEEVDTTKVAADNSKSDKLMPTSIPQVAIDHSVALEVATEEDIRSDVVVADIVVHGNSNASFGQQIAATQPVAAQTDGQDFGQATEESAKNNNRKP